MFSMGYRNIGDALDFTQYLTKECHYVPYSIALHQLQRIMDMFQGSKVHNCVKVSNHWLTLIYCLCWNG